MSARPGNSGNGPQSSAARLESARAAIELRAGRNLTNVEWARASARLLEFVSILRAWKQQAKAPEPGR
jgi:hypothetical protein